MVNENGALEGQISIQNLPLSSSTKKKGGWRAIKYILANETFEKVASMGLIANLIVYMHTQYNMDNTASAQVFTIWAGSTNFLPLVGAYIADAYAGKFNTLFFSSIASFLGMGFVALGAGVPSLRPPSCSTHSETGYSDCIPATGSQLAILYVGLALFAVGSGGLRPCNISFGADQFDITTEKGRSHLESFFNWWYFLFTVALLLALTIVVYIQTNISWFLGFIIPTVCFACSLTIFILGRNTYIRSKPKGSVISDLVKVVVAANRNRHVDIKKDIGLSFYDPPLDSESDPRMSKLPHTNRFRFFDKAAVITDPSESGNDENSVDTWRLCSVQNVEELKSVLATLPVWLAGILCFLSMTQANSFGILQVIQTHKSIGKFIIPPAWMGLVPMIALSIWIFLYEKIYVPYKDTRNKRGTRLTVEQRILIGIVLSIVCMLVSGLVEVHRRETALKHGLFESPASIWWLVPQFALSGLVEAFAAVAMMELLTSYWPDSMKTLGGAMFFLSLSICNYLNSLLIKIIQSATTGKNGTIPWLGGNDLNKNRLEYYYYTIAVLAGLNLLYFQFIARSYLHSEALQTSNKVDPEDEEKGNSNMLSHT